MFNTKGKIQGKDISHAMEIALQMTLNKKPQPKQVTGLQTSSFEMKA